jgi:molybdopterin-guanine dinucleotide biosynthesis protein A
MINPKQITGVVLAGGLSRRMGQDKGSMLFRDKALILYSYEVLKPFVNSVWLSSNQKPHASFGLPMLADIHHSIGPIGGLHAALIAAPTEWILVLPCDTPLVQAELIMQLFNTSISTDCQAIVPSHDGHFEPLFALYHKNTIDQINIQISKGDYKMTHFIEQINTVIVQVSQQKSFVNINTPEDFNKLSTDL